MFKWTDKTNKKLIRQINKIKNDFIILNKIEDEKYIELLNRFIDYYLKNI
jgi:hypothetical protein